MAHAIAKEWDSKREKTVSHRATWGLLLVLVLGVVVWCGWALDDWFHGEHSVQESVHAVLVRGEEQIEFVVIYRVVGLGENVWSVDVVAKQSRAGNQHERRVRETVFEGRGGVVRVEVTGDDAVRIRCRNCHQAKLLRNAYQGIAMSMTRV
jgi:hypothetical protein